MATLYDERPEDDEAIMATLYDERPEDDEATNNINEVAEHQEPVAQETPEEEIPEKYQGKSVTDIVRMHQEAEKLLGRQSSEVGEGSYVQLLIATFRHNSTPNKQHQ
jgi:hypothetical protein